MNKLVIGIQILLGIMFTLIGCMKLFAPIATLATSIGWVNLFPEVVVRIIGGVELLGGLGLLIPLWLKRMHRLSAFAALGFMLIMVLACLLHLSRPSEMPLALVNIVIFVLAGIVMFSRFRSGRDKQVEQS